MRHFERYLTLWVALCILAGSALGNLVPGLPQAGDGVDASHPRLRGLRDLLACCEGMVWSSPPNATVRCPG